MAHGLPRDSAGSLLGVSGTKEVKLATSSEAGAPTEAGTQKKPAFRAVVNLLIAIRRFQSALNPRYSPGKREQETDSVVFNPLAASAGRTVSGPNPMRAGFSGPTASRARTASRTLTSSGMRTASGRPVTSGIQHGYKSHILLRPLPEVEPVSQ